MWINVSFTSFGYHDVIKMPFKLKKVIFFYFWKYLNWVIRYQRITPCDCKNLYLFFLPKLLWHEYLKNPNTNHLEKSHRDPSWPWHGGKVIFVMITYPWRHGDVIFWKTSMSNFSKIKAHFLIKFGVMKVHIMLYQKNGITRFCGGENSE